MKRFLNTFSLCAIAAVSMMFTLRVTAQPAMEWEENPQIGVEINGKIDLNSAIYQPVSYKPYLLLVSKTLKDPVLIDLGQKHVSILKPTDVKTDQGFAKTTGIPSGAASGSYSMKGHSSVFTVKGKKVGITVRQTLVGEVSPAMILAYNPEYGMRMKQYKPKQATIKKLKSHAKKTEVVVMFATWCSTCKVTLPKVMRIFKDVANPNLPVKYIGIAMGGNEPRDAIAKYGHDYPAVIFLQNGKEIQRVIGDPPGAMEDLFVTILK